jgi:hypothetical protein
MKVKKLVISFPASPSPDVVGYKLYVEEAPNPVTYDSQAVDLGNQTIVDLSSLPGMTTKDGVYNLGLVAVDDGENESSMSVVEGVHLDFLAPDPPGQIVLERT